MSARKRLVRAWFFGLFLSAVPLSLPATAAAQLTATQGAQELPTDPGIRIGTLDNGLRYYIRANAEPRNRAELRLAVNAGSVLEDDDQRGLAHLLEHMAFNGTRNFEKQELVRYLESVGMRFGPDVNAYTSFDETVYMLTLPTDSMRILETGFQILEDWAHGIVLDSLEIEKERGVVIEEWRLGRGAQARLRDLEFPVIFRGSRYAERLPIGTLESLQTARPSAVERFYRQWYRPDLMAVVAVGDFDPQVIEGLVREHFSRIPAPQIARERPLFPVPDHVEPLVSIATDPEATLTTVTVLYKQPVRSMSTVADYRRQLVEALYNGMLNDRLAEITRRANPPFASAGSAQGRIVRSKEVYQLQALVAEAGIERALEALLTEAERVARHGFVPSELERQRSALLRWIDRAYAERERTTSAQYAAEYIRNFLVDEPIPGLEFEHELYHRLLPGVALEEVNALAREWLTDANRVVLVSAPEVADTRVPAADALLALFERVESGTVDAYAEVVSDEPLLERPSRPGSVVATREIPEIGVTEWTLGNGARVLLKPTDFKDDEILFSAYGFGGTSLLDDRDHVIAMTTSTVVAEAARLGPLSPTELRRRLADKVVRVTPAIGTLEEGISGAASPRDLETLFQLVHLYFTATRPDTAAFEGLRARLRSVYQNMAANPEQNFQDSVQVVLAQRHPRARPFSAAGIDQMDIGRSFEFFQSRFSDAGDFTFAFVGSFEPEELRPLVEAYLATLPTTGRADRWRDPGIEYPRGVVQKEVRRGLEAKSQTRFVFTGDFDFNREELHALSSLADVLRSRLRDELREELGGTYGVSVGASAAQVPRPTYRFDIVFGSAPERREELAARVLAQIDSIRAHPPTQQEVATVQEQQRRALELNLRQNAYWLSTILAYDRRGWDLRELGEEERRISNLDAATIQRAARRYLDTTNYVLAWLLPEVDVAVP